MGSKTVTPLPLTLPLMPSTVHDQRRCAMKKAIGALAGIAALLLLTAAYSKSATPVSKPATSGNPVSRSPVAVSVKEFSLTPATSTAPAGTVTFSITNGGKIAHEFVVLKTDASAAGVPTQNGQASEHGDLGEAEDIAPGATKTLALKLAPGHYALVCNIPGHYLAGMHADFTIGS
jgi:uncharacterized cupredoxin-like copper-binding protein